MSSNNDDYCRTDYVIDTRVSNVLIFGKIGIVLDKHQDPHKQWQQLKEHMDLYLKHLGETKVHSQEKAKEVIKKIE